MQIKEIDPGANPNQGVGTGHNKTFANPLTQQIDCFVVRQC